jgi:protein gp37
MTTGIEWTDETWNPIVGCSLVSPGCTNCYAMKFAGRVLDKESSPALHYHGTTKTVNSHIVWTGKVALAPDHILTAPLRWKKPRKIFVNSMGDLFHESVPDEWIDKVFAVMALSPQHTFQVLTKRSKRMREYFATLYHTSPHISRVTEFMWTLSKQRTDHINGGIPLRNVWLGVSCEDETRADERINDLLATPAAVRFVSAEPLLGPIDFSYWLSVNRFLKIPKLDWIIAGGESGHGARPMHPDWVRSIRDQRESTGTAFFFKQWGEWKLEPADSGSEQWPAQWSGDAPPKKGDIATMVRIGKAKAGRLLDGKLHNQFPEAK